MNDVVKEVEISQAKSSTQPTNTTQSKLILPPGNFFLNFLITFIKPIIQALFIYSSLIYLFKVILYYIHFSL